MTIFDAKGELGVRALQRLESEHIIWLTTVSSDGTPQPSPVWFYWDGSVIMIRSKPDAPKIRNSERSTKVALSFNSDPDGGNIVVITGDAQIELDISSTKMEPYLDKYREDIPGLNTTSEALMQEYSATLLITPRTLRGF